MEKLKAQNAYLEAKERNDFAAMSHLQDKIGGSTTGIFYNLHPGLARLKKPIIKPTQNFQKKPTEILVFLGFFKKIDENLEDFSFKVMIRNIIRMIVFLRFYSIRILE